MDVSGQMYKVFFNNILLVVVQNRELFSGLEEASELMVNEAIEKTNWQIWLAEQEEKTYKVFIENGFSEFKKNFRIIEAAGGIVINKEQQLLLIYRNQKWDLPKGKLEVNEQIKSAALREVEEETGVDVMLTTNEIYRTTYHAYFHKVEMVLKPTYWFMMNATSVENAKPQLEEGIDALEWVDLEKVIEFVNGNSFRSITNLISGLSKDRFSTFYF